MKIIKEAEIEIVKFSDLKIGDEILWSNLRCKVDGIDMFRRELRFSDVNQFAGSFCYSAYSNYYKLIKYVEVNLCYQCEKEIEFGDVCDECKKADIEYSKSLKRDYGEKNER